MTPSEEKAFKNFCDLIMEKLETEKGREIVADTVNALRNGLIDKFHLLTEENVKQMLVLHIATLPIFNSLFGNGVYNPITMILNKAVDRFLGGDND